ncbi:LysM peptidoglycan-binding domain-containing protein [Falsiroseomonas sp. HW251]|uniref:LysM peptidoglycan-binding domain-containing protein n=1 Tax=Falsiroseomonas sp. HW251 TaxID=3390998 RepID=UPI003D3131FA
MTSSARALLAVVVVAGGLGAFLAGQFLGDARPVTVTALAPPPPAPPVAAPPAQPPAPVAQAPAPEPPRFDVVRVGARGVAVIAGRAAPGAEVVLMEDGRELGRARADARGEWVILPSDPLRPGTRQFTLLARLGGQDVPGPDTVVVVVPEAAIADARPEDSRAEAIRRAEADARAHADVLSRAEQQRRDAEAVLQAAHDETARRVAARAEEQARATERAAAEQARRAEAAAEQARRADGPAPQPLVVLLPPAQAAAPRLLQGPAPASQQSLALGLVDYDEGGLIRFAGTAAPGSTVRVYVNNQHAGDAAVDAQGRWALAPGERVSVGRHTLRLDQVAAAGAVAARIEVPFQRDAVAEGAADGRVVVQPGNNLWRLARASYGRGTQFTVIYDANREQIRNPNRIFPGQVFSVPGAPLAASPGAPLAASAGATPADSSRSR